MRKSETFILPQPKISQTLFGKECEYMVKIISDSTCDLSQELLRNTRIDILPLHILLGDKEYEDGKNITPDQRSMPGLMQTRQHLKLLHLPWQMPWSFFAHMQRLEGKLSAFSISAGMSTSGNVMRLAAEELGASDRIKVIDSANLSTGIGLLCNRGCNYGKE